MSTVEKDAPELPTAKQAAALDNLRRDPTPTIIPELLATAEVAKMLGAGQRSIWRWSRSGVMPAPVHIGSAVRFRRDEILDWLDAGCPRVGRAAR